MIKITPKITDATNPVTNYVTAIKNDIKENISKELEACIPNLKKIADDIKRLTKLQQKAARPDTKDKHQKKIKTQKNNYKQELKNAIHNPDACVRFLAYYLDNIEYFLNDPSQIQQDKIKQHYNKAIKCSCKKEEEKKKCVVLCNNKLKEFMEKLYAKIRQNDAAMKGLTNIEVCPYCNINYTYTDQIDPADATKFFFELDHFKDKANHPWLALSFYNLVPSCHTCNHIKSTQEFVEINPYKRGFNCRFYMSPIKNQVEGFLPYTEKDFELDFKDLNSDTLNDDKEKAQVEGFLLKKRYQHHKDIALDIVQRAIRYNQAYLQGLSEFFAPIDSNLQKNDLEYQQNPNVREYARSIIFSDIPKKEDMGNISLGKLRHDIAKDLGII